MLCINNSTSKLFPLRSKLTDSAKRLTSRSAPPFEILGNPSCVLLLIIFLALIERIAMFFIIGSGVLSNSDDVAYVQSGIVFANTGVISVWSDYPTAKIMPGMPVLCGLFSFIFGEGIAYINAMRFFMIVLGCCSIYVFYLACCEIMPKWYAVFASVSFLLPNWAWSDNNILTEPPYLLFYLTTVLYTFRIGNESTPSRRSVLGYTAGFMLALMFRANILTMPFFSAVYLILFKKRPIKSLVRPTLILISCLLLFIVPWSLRNYKVFDEFIPITNGAANPTLLGTYQGKTAPSDEELDYETNVYSVIREEYAEYYNENGYIKDLAYAEYINDKTDRLKAEYRLQEWFKRDAKGLIWSYLVSKPACMLNWVWEWLPNPTLYNTLHYISCINFIMCILTLVLSFSLKKQRKAVVFLSFIYWINIYIFAFSFASERYSAMLMPFRYMLCAIGLQLAIDAFHSFKVHAQANNRKTQKML